VIRQAISCDICAAEKKQTNHWFVAYEQDGELRVSGWSSRKRLRPGAKHLCGQTCLHKLMDDFMARTLAARLPQAAADDAASEVQETAVKDTVLKQALGTDTSLTSSAAFEDAEFESSARLIPAPAPVAPARPPLRTPMELVAAPARPNAGETIVPVDDEPPRFATRNWRAAAWERERERELRANDRHSASPARRRFN
jgi:hypothetical protein